MCAVGVVLGLRAETDLDVGGAAMGLVLAGERAELGGHADVFGVGDRVGDEVGAGLRGVFFAGLGGRRCGGARTEGAHGAGELGLHDLHEDGVGLDGARRTTRGKGSMGSDGQGGEREAGQDAMVQRGAPLGSGVRYRRVYPIQ